MIVSHGTSQTVFIIDSVRYSCYNNDENRIIAEILFEEQYCQVMLNLCDKENDELRIQKQKFENYYIQSRKYNNELQRQLDQSIIIGKEFEQAYIETDRKLQISNKRLTYSIIGNIILTTLIIVL